MTVIHQHTVFVDGGMGSSLVTFKEVDQGKMPDAESYKNDPWISVSLNQREHGVWNLAI